MHHRLCLRRGGLGFGGVGDIRIRERREKRALAPGEAARGGAWRRRKVSGGGRRAGDGCATSEVGAVVRRW